MMINEVIVDKGVIRLGPRIGKGGEGEVYKLGSDDKFAIKVYTTKDKSSREDKISAMIRAELSKKAPLVAFPISIAKNSRGEFVGFVMPLVSGHKPLHELYSPGPRKQNFPQADFRFLVRVAKNVARAIASVHRSNCVIGDINHSSMLVAQNALVALIDADSFQIIERDKSFLCRVGVPEYTPPELQGLRLDGVRRTENHDAFGLAIVIFQLLFMGRHPFVGTVRSGEIPPLHENIQNFRYVYGDSRNVGMDQPPGTPSVTDFSPAIAQLFERAFSKETSENRPSAEDWNAALEQLEGTLTKCQDNSLHYIPKDASDCAWCEMERELNTVLFLPNFLTSGLANIGQLGSLDDFNLDRVWAQISGVVIPSRSTIQPLLKIRVANPSNTAKSAKENAIPKSTGRGVGTVLALAALAGFAFAPTLFFIWGILLFYGISKFRETSSISIDKQQFERAYIEAHHRYQTALDNWYKQIGLNSLEELRASLEKAKLDYQSLASDEDARVAKYRTERRERQLQAFLDRFDLQHVKLKGIGPAGKATLASYGIDTAADVSEARLSGVPGFRGTKMVTLMEWRKSLEQRFIYSPAENDDDRREIALIKASTANKAIPLRKMLLEGAQRLLVARAEVQKRAESPSSIIDGAATGLEEARVDLHFLGLTTPHIPTPQQRSASTASTASIVSPKLSNPSVPVGTTLVCPRCSSRMAKRRARRGRNAGRYFWGCTRYPVCKGTRNA